MASAHLSNLQSKCEYVIRMSTTVTDPENPVFDPQYTALLSAFLSTTCPDNCSNHGQCVDGECECHSGMRTPTQVQLIIFSVLVTSYLTKVNTNLV